MLRVVERLSERRLGNGNGNGNWHRHEAKARHGLLADLVRSRLHGRKVRCETSDEVQRLEHDVVGAVAPGRFARGVLVRLDSRRLAADDVGTIAGLLGEHRGATPVVFEYRNARASCRIKGGARRAVAPSPELLDALGRRLGREAVELVY